MLYKSPSSVKTILLLLFLALILFIAFMINPFKKSSKYEIVETRNFSCPSMTGFTLKYPIFKGWEPVGMRNTGQSECTIFLSDENLKINHVSTEVAPQIK